MNKLKTRKNKLEGKNVAEGERKKENGGKVLVAGKITIEEEENHSILSLSWIFSVINLHYLRKEGKNISSIFHNFESVNKN